jgi:hypothetical protein
MDIARRPINGLMRVVLSHKLSSLARGPVLEGAVTNCFCVLKKTLAEGSNAMAWEAGAVERARELLQKALAAKDSKEALKICENFELQVSPARARVVVRFAVAR